VNRAWDGSNDRDPTLKGDELNGMIFFHGGADSELVAKQKSGNKSKQ
jgi:hypothetical protein